MCESKRYNQLCADSWKKTILKDIKDLEEEIVEFEATLKMKQALNKTKKLTVIRE